MLNRLLAASLVVSLVGCATPAMQQGMTVQPGDIAVKPSEKLKGQVFVRSVSGGQETNPLLASQVDSPTFKTSLEQSLAAFGYRSEDPSAKYRIDANLQDLHQPAFGFTLSVQSTVAYTVATDSGSTVVPITETGTASTSDTLYGVERMRIANERSIKENIKAFIKRLTRQFGE